MIKLFIMPFIILGLVTLSTLGCQTVKQDVDDAEKDFRLDSDPMYPDGLEKEIEERGEP